MMEVHMSVCLFRVKVTVKMNREHQKDINIGSTCWNKMQIRQKKSVSRGLIETFCPPNSTNVFNLL